MRRSIVREKISELLESGHTHVEGKCHDCSKPVSYMIGYDENDEPKCAGPFWFYDFDLRSRQGFIKCMECYGKDPILRNFQPCEVYSRIVGYLRPVQGWNPGKKEEFRRRTTFDMGKAGLE